MEVVSAMDILREQVLQLALQARESSGALRGFGPKCQTLFVLEHHAKTYANLSHNSFLHEITMTRFLDLPVELIAEILIYLDTQDVFSLRQVSKHLEYATLSSFGRRYFRKKGYLITTPSLQTLWRVSEQDQLRKYVQHVWFNPDCYTFQEKAFTSPEQLSHGEAIQDLEFDLTAKEAEELENVQKRFTAYRNCVADHEGLLYSPPELANHLTIAFRNLPNLRAIGMRRSEDHRPWGWQKLRDTIGEDPRTIGQYREGPKRLLSGPTMLFIAVVNATAEAEVDLHRLYTDAIEIDNIPVEILPQAQLDVACQHLLYLEINIHRGWLKDDIDGKHIKCDNKDDYGEGLLRLLKAVPQLRELGLQIFADMMRSYMLPPTAADPNSWLAAYPHLTFKKQVDNVVLSNLTRLKLEKITTVPSVLKAFMEPSMLSLTSLKLRDIRLISEKDQTRPWHPVFEFFRLHCKELTYMLLYHLMYESGGVSFVERPPTMVAYLDIQDQEHNPNPPHGEPAGGEFFTRYDHIALEASGLQKVESKLEQIVHGHWYQPPIFSYVMDDDLWHTDTSDEEW